MLQKVARPVQRQISGQLRRVAKRLFESPCTATLTPCTAKPLTALRQQHPGWQALIALFQAPPPLAFLL